ncbi:hypothetical protein MYCTH_2306956 [Thermothelomyces thermophilus ATCC 42464]|uniref:DRBM domain-containing protein n=1 Tax=Thermothelomyces thermophilus (strain ATCC 42464 / BCRC 31852 / DSM 1799) TaxID=573729 RepID=G2QF15_THET4|nr:uncharacterized protein MYCTH_2306956 [Thermothelomyces thermophilus ATCC 42464]AEO59044.1 hypothetical protein MYCTH_2306956 [Thermothelomyces thermophilus ATCC 42464]
MAYCRWTDMLKEICRVNNIAEPEYKLFSDRRGGRTAWSSTVYVSGAPYNSRFWYDGQYLQNAREDAAEVALKCIMPVLMCSPASSPSTSSTTPNLGRRY